MSIYLFSSHIICVCVCVFIYFQVMSHKFISCNSAYNIVSCCFSIFAKFTWVPPLPTSLSFLCEHKR